MMPAGFVIHIESACAVIDRAWPQSDSRPEKHLVGKCCLADSTMADKHNVANIFRGVLGHTGSPFVE